ncbi:GIY-YIG nuclease family protein [Streptomyces sp. GbtcB6]|uniref:GIY-YIG nuclease family protein n=1 Tax=Streptomyces sp. GbtcB6 TaxID=2824751 RepID=UPI001C30375D|nr:GIY-YIG nuclease family protein [Streptomyces sp. GbtcB6]
MTSSAPGGDSYVYVIGSVGSTRVKIGTSVSPKKRLKELQTGNPDRLEVLWCTLGGRKLEAHLHQAFADYRREGEWFDFAGLEPVGAIPAAVHRHSGSTPHSGRPNIATSARRSGVRTDRGEHLVTPERLAGIVKDVVLGVIRPEPKQEESGVEDREVVPIKRQHNVDEDMNRLMAFMYESAAIRHAQRAVAGKTGLAALGGWPNLLLLAVLTVVAMPIAAFLGLRAVTRDIWPVRKLPKLAIVGFGLWGPFGFDKLIRDVVLSHLPVDDIETFARTYFTQAAVTGTYLLAFISLGMCLMGYAQLVRDTTEEQRAKAKQQVKRKPLDSVQLAAQAAAALEAAAMIQATSGRSGATTVVSSPLIADLAQAVPRQPRVKKP